MRDVVIVDALRSPIGKRGGTLKDVRPDDLMAEVLSALVNRSHIDPAQIEDVVIGCVTQVGEQGWNVARLAALQAGLPVTAPATTINRMCGSGQQAVHFAAQAIASGDIDVAIAGGVESMNRVKMGSDGKDFSPRLLEKYDLVWQGTSAEMMAKKFDLSRRALDEFSLRSHQRAIAAAGAGWFKSEIAPVKFNDNGNSVSLEQDEGPRSDTSLEALGALKPAFTETGVITAGNSSQISDGAAAMLLMSLAKAKELDLRPRARVLSRVVVGSDPILMLDGVIPATQKALRKASISIEDIDVFEVNEAFASVVLGWMKETGVDPAKVNPNGGAISLGHPLGASGTRILTSLLNELERREARYGLQTMCIGHGMATATIIERMPTP